MKKIIPTLIRIYQKTISPNHGVFISLTGPVECRFYPTCSEYALQSFEKYSLSKAAAKTIRRIAKCNPLNKGGVDLP